MKKLWFYDVYHPVAQAQRTTQAPDSTYDVTANKIGPDNLFPGWVGPTCISCTSSQSQYFNRTAEGARG